jgi:type IV pilus assembly protein PilQ
MKNAIFNSVYASRFMTWVSACLLLLAGASALAANPPTSNAIIGVEPAILSGNRVVVRIHLKEPLKATPAGFTVGTPPRIAMDLPDTGNAIGKSTVDAYLGPLTSVNVVQAGTRTRLVFNLSKSVEYETKIEGKSLIVGFNETGTAATTTNVTPRFAEAAPAAVPHAIKNVEFRRGPNGEARIVTTLADAQTGINIRQQAKGVVIDFIDTALPKELQRRLEVTDFATPVTQVESYTLGENTRMVIDSKGAWEYSAYQADNQFIVEVRAAVQEDRKTADGKPIYKGEKLSLNFQNVEVRSVLQVIADFTGLNIVASDTVGGNLTLRLKDVPWDQALDLILTTKGLDKRTNGNVVWIAPKDELLNKEKAELEARASVNDLEPMITEFIPLNYIRADEAQTMLYGFSMGSFLAGTGKASCSVASEGLDGKAVAQAFQQGKESDQKVLSKRGRATYDLKTNTLIINDTAKKIQEVRDLLAKIDVPARQVMIEARVVIADDTFARQLGARLGGRLGGSSSIGGSQTGIGLGSGLNDSFNLAHGTPVGSTLPNVDLGIASTITGANPATIGLTLLNIATGNLISLELQALEADNRGKVISNPRVVTTNQKPAVILQGVQIPYSTAESSSTGEVGTNTVQFVDAFLCLLVDPQILNNDSVILNVEVQKDAPGQTSFAGLPALDRRRVKTQVRVNNGETVVLGGIYETVNRNDVSKVPFLGDLPFLGHLFKNSDRREIKTETMIFITPRILDERLSLR